VEWGSFVDNAVLQAGYMVVFGALAYARFVRKDILS
jgi:ABC-2 type transport system permease protein